MSDPNCFVIIHGNDWSLRDKNPNEYVRHISYGDPTVTTVVADGHFVALVEYPSEDYGIAVATMERMASFSYGASLMVDRLIALREMGTWLYHNAETAKPLPKEDPEQAWLSEQELRHNTQ
jgi:hypothetical protein